MKILAGILLALFILDCVLDGKSHKQEIKEMREDDKNADDK